MATEAQKRARKNYRDREKAAGRRHTILLEFGRNDQDIYDFAKAQAPTATYIKGLIRSDLVRS